MRSSSRFFQPLNASRLLRLGAPMWSFSQTTSVPISYGGSQLTRENAWQKLTSPAASGYLTRTMKCTEFEKEPLLLASNNARIPLGLTGQAQLTVYNEDGTLNQAATNRNYQGHHKPDSKEHKGHGLSFSDGYTLYSLLPMVTGLSSILLVDPTAIPPSHCYQQNASNDNTLHYEPDGTPSIHTYEKEVTLQDVPITAIVGEIRRASFASNPCFIDCNNPETPR